MKTKGIRITYKDYRRLTRLIYPRKEETIAEYLHRVVNYIEEYKQNEMTMEEY